MDHRIVIARWTGRHATALKLALRMSSEAFAERLGVGLRTVAQWSREPDIVPSTVMQHALDTLLSHSDDDAQTRFAVLAYGRSSPASATPDTTTATDLATAGLLDWVDLHAGWEPGTARLQLHDQLAQTSPLLAQQKAAQRAQVARSSIAASINALYRSPRGEHRLYTVRCGTTTATTSILTNSEWTESTVPLGAGHDSLRASDTSTPTLNLDETAAAAAVSRIVESINLRTRIFDAALYCLTHIDITHHSISGQLRLANFTDYALTLDLLENELIDAIISANGQVRWSQLPLRKRYLGSVEHALNLHERLCAGGPLALLAIARPPARGHGQDYALIVQERSTRVLNGVGRLAVIPKAFHQPLSDFSDDAQLSVTLERELEEELLGRDELQLAPGPAQHLDPLHRTRLSQPMRWLVERAGSDAWWMECTGFGLNLVSGNYEFASLITIEDDEWWTSFGGQLITNWEAEGIRI